MKISLFFQVMLGTLIVCSAFYVQYRKNDDSVQAMSSISEYVRSYNSNMTFTDLAKRCF